MATTKKKAASAEKSGKWVPPWAKKEKTSKTATKKSTSAKATYKTGGMTNPNKPVKSSPMKKGGSVKK